MPNSSIIPRLVISPDLRPLVCTEDADVTGIASDLIDQLGRTCGASSMALFWALIVTEKRSGETTIPGIATSFNLHQGVVRAAALKLESAGFIQITNKGNLPRHERSYGRWFARNRHRYPDNWKEIAGRIKDLAGWKCEACGNPHGAPPYVLTVDHCVDHDPMNVADENLAALCQRCHLRRHGMKPKPQTKADAIERLRQRYQAEQGQQTLPLEREC